MSTPAAPAVWLKRTFHDARSLADGGEERRNLDSSQRPLECQLSGPDLHSLALGPGVWYSRGPRSVRVVPPSFPQLWKKMWKSQGFRPDPASRWRSGAGFAGAKVQNVPVFRDESAVRLQQPFPLPERSGGESLLNGSHATQA